VQKWTGPKADDEHHEDNADADEDADAAADASQDSIKAAGMDVDEDASVDALAAEVEQQTTSPEDDSDDEDEDDPSNVALVPIADMLNARHGSGNVRACSCQYMRSRSEPHPGKALLRANGIENDHNEGDR
jgi:SET domain-containing protein 6